MDEQQADKTKRTGPLANILIVGGGTAGWMSALFLSRFLTGSNCKITLLESSSVPTVGVGEATIPSLVKFVRSMKLDEHEFMRRCHATYKLGINFVDWIEEDSEYWHPFGVVGATVKGVDLFHFWLKALREGHDVGTYASYCMQTKLSEAGRAPRPLESSSPIIQQGAYAYHLDAGALATYLRELALAEGVQHVVDHVQHTELDDAGFIQHVSTEGGRQLSADLFLDCTGSRSLLIEKALGDPYVDWSDMLICDRAVVTQLPPDIDILPYTKSTALKAGWVWRIPLMNRVGCGYVFSSAHTDDESAARELLNYAKGSHAKEAVMEPRFLNMRVGRRSEFWVKNCVSVGLAAGFIEPLESTGIFLIQRSLEMLTKYLPERSCHSSLQENYNQRMSLIYEHARDFIVTHYLLNRRENDPFWRDSKAITIPESLRVILDLYDELGTIEPVRSSPFSETSWYCILAGGDRLPRRSIPDIYLPEMNGLLDLLNKVRAQNSNVVPSLPSHQMLLESIHQSPLD
jgi:tryptophan halogenase